MFLSVRNAGKAEATRFICKRRYRRAVEPDGNVGFALELTAVPHDLSPALPVKVWRWLRDSLI